MANAEATITVNDQGVVETLSVAGEEFERVAGAANELDTKLNNLDEAFSLASEEGLTLADALEQVNSDVENVGKRVDALLSLASKFDVKFSQLAASIDITQESEKFVEQFNSVHGELERVEQQAQETKEEADDLGMSMSTTSQDTSDFGDKAEKASESADDMGLSMSTTSEDTSDFGSEAEEAADSAQSLEEKMEKLKVGSSTLSEETISLAKDLELFKEESFTAEEVVAELEQIAEETGQSFKDLSVAIDLTQTDTLVSQLNDLRETAAKVPEDIDDIDQSLDDAEESAVDFSRVTLDVSDNVREMIQSLSKEELLDKLRRSVELTREEFVAILQSTQALKGEFSNVDKQLQRLDETASRSGIAFEKLTKNINILQDPTRTSFKLKRLEEQVEEAGNQVLETSRQLRILRGEFENTSQASREFDISQVSDVAPTREVGRATPQANLEEFDRITRAAEEYKREIRQLGRQTSSLSEEQKDTSTSTKSLTQLTIESSQAQEKAAQSTQEHEQEQLSLAERIEKSIATFEDFDTELEQLAKAFGLSASEADVLIRQTDEFDKIKDRIRKLSDQAEFVDASFKQLAASTNILAKDQQQFKENAQEVITALHNNKISADDLSESYKQLDDILGKVRSEQADQAETTKELAQATLQADRTTDKYGESIAVNRARTEQMNATIKDRLNGLQRSEQQMAKNILKQKQLQQTSRGLSTEFRKAGVRTGTMNEVLFSAGDTIQDLQFGIRGAGNNLAFMAENLVQAQQKAGSFKNVLSELGSTIMGPIGIIVALQGLLVALPKIIDFFQSSEEEAKSFLDTVKEAAGELVSFSESIEGFEAENIEQLRKSKEILEERAKAQKEEVDTLRTLLKVNDLHRSQVDAVSDISANQRAILKERFNLQNASTKEVREKFKQEQAVLKTMEKNASKMEGMIQTRKARKLAAEELKETELDTAEATSKQKENLEKVRQKVVKVRDKFINLSENISSVDFDTELDLQLEDILQSTQDVSEFFEAGFIDSIDKASQAIGVLESNLKQIEGTGEEAEQERSRINGLIEDITKLRSEMKSAGKDAENAFTSVADVQTALNLGEVDTPKKVGQALDFLNKKLETTSFDSEKSRERIKRLIKTLQALNGQAKKTGNKGVQQLASEIDSFSGGIGKIADNVDKVGQLTGILTQNFTELGKAIGQGKNVMESFGKAALGVLGDVAAAIGKILIKQGAAMIASALIPGQQGNALVGAKLVAAGSALVATSSAIAGGSQGSGSNTSEPDQTEDLEGGGESGFEIGEDNSNTPGRRRGGPVKAGKVFQTHGLGNREFFVPGVDGKIMTQDQLVGRGRSTQDQVRVVTENRLEGNIEGPDLFELDTRLKEVEKFKEKFARQ